MERRGLRCEALREIESAGAERPARGLAQVPSLGREQHQALQIGSATGAVAGGSKTSLAYGTSHRCNSVEFIVGQVRGTA
jgi:hypothetical protein